MMILDVMLPGMNGYEIARRARGSDIDAPILMLTAKAEVDDKVRGFDCGADDYLTKPFDTDELLARVKALTRRKGELILNEITFADITLDLNTIVLRCGAKDVQLSPKEFQILRIMMGEPKMTYSKDILISQAWGLDSEATDNNVEAYVSFLRKKLRYLNSKVTIKNLQKIGYRLEVNV